MSGINFFSGISNNNSGLYNSLGDLASIKSGNYKRLAKKYYSENETKTDNSIGNQKAKRISNTAYDYRRGDYVKNLQSTSTSKVTASTAASIEKSISALQDSAKAVKDAGGDKDKLIGATKEFVENYNKLLDTSSESATNRVNKVVNAMTDTVSMYEKNLSDIGISIGKDKMLSIDSVKLANSEVTDIKNLMTKTGSVGYQIELGAAKIDRAVRNETSRANTYTGMGAYSYNFNVGSIFNKSF